MVILFFMQVCCPRTCNKEEVHSTCNCNRTIVINFGFWTGGGGGSIAVQRERKLWVGES